MMTVTRPGMLTTVQDRGRHGFQHLGVPVAGPMDWWSHEAANALVGNAPDAALLEVTLIGPELEFSRSATAAVVGAAFELSLSGRSVAMNQPFAIEAGQRLTFGRRAAGARAYLAVDGGIGVAGVMGSRATHVKAGLGGFEGRALRRGDVVPLARAGTGTAPMERACTPLIPTSFPAVLRAIEGPEDPDAAFWRSVFTISPQSDRMGYRLVFSGGDPYTPPSLVARGDPDAPLRSSAGAQVAAAGDQLSSAVAMGTVQVTPSGTCVLLMADRATSGGYARAATVITADLPIAGQLAPGDSLRFERVTLEEARRAHAARRAALPAA